MNTTVAVECCVIRSVHIETTDNDTFGNINDGICRKDDIIAVTESIGILGTDDADVGLLAFPIVGNLNRCVLLPNTVTALPEHCERVGVGVQPDSGILVSGGIFTELKFVPVSRRFGVDRLTFPYQRQNAASGDSIEGFTALYHERRIRFGNQIPARI